MDLYELLRNSRDLIDADTDMDSEYVRALTEIIATTIVVVDGDERKALVRNLLGETSR